MTTLRILVAAASEAGSHFANAINTFKTADAFVRLGHEVSLICWRSKDGKYDAENLAQIYGTSPALQWVQVPRPAFRRFSMPRWLFGVEVIPSIIAKRPDLVYARDFIVPVMSTRLRTKTVIESHTDPANLTREFRLAVRSSRSRFTCGWITISDVLADGYVRRGVPRSKIAVLPDAVDLRLFEPPNTLPRDAPFEDPVAGKRVVYAGHLYDYKGIPTLIQAAGLLPHVRFHVIGGWPQDVEKQRERSLAMGVHNIVFHGQVDHANVASFLWHSDALILPTSADHISATWTSPLKLAEYLAARRPIIATDIPGVRNWVTGEHVEFVAPDDPSAMAKGIERVLSDGSRALAMVEKGAELAQTFSYENRASAILDRAFSI